VATLGEVGPRFGFTSFSRAGMQVEPLPQDRRAQVLQRFNEMMSAKAALPPPAQVEIVEKEVQRALTSAQITAFGFSCPSCRNKRPLLCPTCQKYSCQGGQQDSAGRIQCQWCGEVLVFFTRAPGEDAPDIRIDAATKDLQLRTRELRSGTDQAEQRSQG